MAETNLNETPAGNRPKIAIAGCRNAGKSSFINALTGQDIAIVSDVPGTTADPVYKPMEILPLGPVMIIDTAGLDDSGKLGRLRIAKTESVIKTSDFVFHIIAGDRGITAFDKKILKGIVEKNISCAIVINKIDISQKKISIPKEYSKIPVFRVSSLTKSGIEEIKNRLPEVFPQKRERFIIADLIQGGDIVVLVVPIDLSAPKGRLILPQVQTIREILDSDAIAVVSKERALRYTLDSLKQPPKLVVTDSQAIMKVAADVAKNIPLTTFSVLFARYKGDLQQLTENVHRLNSLKDGDQIIIIEACSHHSQPDDLGRVKIPRWLTNHTGRKLKFDFFAGKEIPTNLKKYKMGIHCGGCMLNQKEMESRLESFKEFKLPIINYGIAISYAHNAFPRVLKIFPEVYSKFSGKKNE